MRALFAVLMLQIAAGAPLASAQTTGSELPDIGSPANTTLSLEDEYKIGLMIVRSMRDAGQIVDDPEINEYLQSLGMRLASQAHEGAHRFTFFAVRDTSINAFALPGGFIGVNAGLVKATRSEAELAGVLAHEIAHVTQRHIARSIQNAGRANLASAAAMLAAILIGATTGIPSDAVLGTVTAAQGLAAQSQINYTRENEAEADRVGIGILGAAGFDPVAMPEFFGTMQQRTGGAGRNIPDLLRSHPVTSERIAETRDRASRMPRPRTPDSTGYALIRDRLELETLSSEVSPLDMYANAKSADYPSTDAEQYGRALALVQAGKAGEAIPMLESLRNRRPDVTLYHTALGQAELAAGLVDESRKTLEDAMRLFPRNVPVTMRYAETLMRAGDPKRAHIVLLDLFNNVPPTAEQARYTALAANAAGDVADSYYYMSEYHVISGDLALAINQLHLAQAVPGINVVQRERLRRAHPGAAGIPAERQEGARRRRARGPRTRASARAQRRQLESQPELPQEMPMMTLLRAAAGALLLAVLTGCATTNMGTPGDPLERMNRATYRFNDSLDRHVMKPVAKGYVKHVPSLVRQGVDNFLENLAFPTTIVNDLLQLKIKDTLVDLGRFTVNSTLGIGGILNPANAFGIPKNDEDFGQTLGRWGVPAGPYVVLPFLGPSTLRDAPSWYVDAQTDLRITLDLDATTEWALVGVSLVNRRSELLPYDASFDSAYDRYAFIRNAWLQRREYQVKDGEVEDAIPQEELEDPAAAGDAIPTEAPPADATPEKPADQPPADAPPEKPADQPPGIGASSSATSLMPASEAIADGMLR